MMKKGFGQLGASIMEFMAAMTVGLILVGFVGSIYVNGVSAQKAQKGINRIQEGARFGTMLVSGEVGKAGYRNVGGLPAIFMGKKFGPLGQTEFPAGTKIYSVFGVDGAAAVPGSNTFSGDTLRLAFYGENDPAASTNVADGRMLDCLGNAVSRDTLVVETFSVQTDASNEPYLACQVTYVAGTAGAPNGCTAGSTCANAAVNMLKGIESVQFLYGVDDDGNGVVNRYLPASAMTASNWGNVLAIKFSMVARSDRDANDPTTVGKTWNHFGSNIYAPSDTPPGNDPGSVYSSPADNRYRIMFSSIASVRNLE